MRSPLKQKPKKSTVSAHGQLDDAEREYQDDLTAYNKKKSKYWYKINGKKVSKAAYNAYENKPGSDEPGKSTNDPDASGNKAKIAKDRANNAASKRPTVLTEAQTKLINYKKTPLDFKSPAKQTVNIPKRPGLKTKKNQNTKISQGTSKKSTTKEYSGPKVKVAEVPFYNAAKGALGYIKKKISR